MNSILIHLQTKEQEEVFEKIAKAFNILYEIKESSPYKEGFVKMVKEADIDYMAGERETIDLYEICN